MKRRTSLMTPLAAAGLAHPGLSPRAISEQTEKKEAGRPRAWTPQEHPRLYFGRNDVEDLRAKRKVDEVAAAAWAQEDVETDVRLFCVTSDQQGEPKRVLMHAGTYLKVHGRTLMGSPKPVTLAVEV